MTLSTPIGEVSVAADDEAVCRVRFGRQEGPPGGPDNRLVVAAAAQLEEYFAGRRTAFDVPLADVGGTDFERAVWAALSTIPYGETRTYGQIADAVGDRGAARAVGMACNRNRLPVLLPCHRVVGAGGKLVGFGGGLRRKRLLLELEARVRVERDFTF
ncbi:methylated-DNA--[protein]-cysteine S-methyltransferase [Planosporangium thailandense]|uniref:Methylated-DNA--protein-cysteine methyltransferase n=2 Tax=Planosporangium thailandense TaxID=765197 RepID=A0ABX0XS69_9ACTN|nr:methylated-DNA--[protein]-cysteine S-methyltransferase [Planosporangium thailandense]NJC68849.1 methylated-DNA--[protein]-cysteine S-methyltransferase [Planosporangium thailandense]